MKAVAVAAFIALLGAIFLASVALADEPQSNSAVPEVPAGATPQPNGSTGNPGTPESNSAVPEVPAGQTPQPNPP